MAPVPKIILEDILIYFIGIRVAGPRATKMAIKETYGYIR